MMSKLVKSLEDLHDNSLETLTHKRDGALRDVEYQQMKISHISQKLNRTRHKLLKIQARMTAAELKIANLMLEKKIISQLRIKNGNVEHHLVAPLYLDRLWKV